MPRLADPASQTSPENRLPRSPQQARGQKRVEAILTACARLLVAHGEGALTMHGLAREARTSIGSLYHFFPDKASVLDALNLHHLQAMREMSARGDGIADAVWRGLDAAQLVDALLRPYLDYFARYPEMLHLIRREQGENEQHPESRELEDNVQALFLRVAALRLPRASELQRRAYCATLFSLPLGMLKQLLLDYDDALRQAILTIEIPRALQAYIDAFERNHGNIPLPPIR